MTSRKLGQVVVESLNGSEMRRAWNLTYGRHADSRDMGDIHKTAVSLLRDAH